MRSNSIEGRRAQEADAVVPPVLRLLVVPDREPGTFSGHLERRTGELIVVRTRQPLLDAARRLLDLGANPARLLTMRHAGAAHDSFLAAPIGRLARWTCKERDRGGITIERWMPFAVPRSGQKSTSAAAAVRAAETEFAPGAPFGPNCP
jgi:hypothetical protein